jgi:site-specific recombinase XerD
MSAPPTPPLVEQYCVWLREQRGATEPTVVLHGRLIQAFVRAAGDEPARYDARRVRAFVLSRVRDHERHAGGTVTTTMRSFLRYLVTGGRCSVDLVGAVPRVPSWRLGKLPPYLAPEAIDRIIGTCLSGTPRQLRDRAILLLLARLGLRASDIVNLRLDDLDWEAGQVRVLGKGRREAWLPLPQEVGDALLAYLARARPAASDSHVFLTARAPRTPLAANSVSARVRVAMAAAGIEAPSRGAHILRHSLASRMLREGATMETIGTVLRHRGMATTALYAKVDVTLLRGIAQPWPGVEVSPC